MKNIFNIKAEDSSLQSKSGGVFGLNQRVNISKFELGSFTKDGETTPTVDINVKIDSREFYNRFFLNLEVYDNNNNRLSPGDEGYDTAFYNHYVQVIAVIKHTLKSLGVTDNAIDNSVQGLGSDQLVQGITNMMGLVPANYTEIPVDVFLEYQWNIPENQTRTFLTLPKNMKGGYFIVPAQNPVGNWKEIRTEQSLTYVDDAGNKHPFERNESFMTSNKAIEQIRGQSTPETPTGQSAGNSLWN